MSSQNEIWPLIRQLSDEFDGNRERSERKLGELQANLEALPSEFRNIIRREMIIIVAFLSRLEVRLVESNGPLDMAV